MFRFSLCTAMSALLTLAACNSHKQEKEPDAVYPVTTALRTDTVVTKDYVAQIKSVKNIEVRAQEKGFLQKIYVDEGQYVQQGQLLFQIMPQVYQAELLKAKAEVAQATIELQNATTLSNSNIVSKNEKAMAKAKLDAANAEVKLAQLHLSFTNIRAPFAGVINRLPLKQGSLVDEGALLTTLSDNSGVYAYFNVSEAEYLNYKMRAAQKENQEVALQLANGQMLAQKGVIQNVEGEFDNETGNIPFRAKFPNPGQLLRNGETGKVQMTVFVNNALIIPQKATYEIQDKKFVFVIDKNGRAKSRNIQVAYTLPDVYFVASGLEPEEQILLDGVQKVKDDQQLKVKFIHPQEVISQLKYSAN